MTQMEVINLLGEPDSPLPGEEDPAGDFTATWKDNGTRVSVDFKSGRVTATHVESR